jgi:aspartyl-tRNA(Asn)/glutamyl-tRNA(Gln) amidotransferase subunit B
VVKQQTLHWDDSAGRTNVLRTKEDADDYRYFLEPDLVPLAPDAAWIERVRAALPPLPAARREALATLTGAGKESEAVAVIVERGQDEYISAVAKVGGDAARALIYVQQAFAEEPATPRVPAGDIAALSLMEKNAKLTSTQAKTLLAELVANGGGDVLAMAKAKGFEAMATGALESIVDQAIAADPQARVALSSALFAEIQDAFNAAGVQIMSPHYLGDPAQPKIVPRERWQGRAGSEPRS